MRQLLTLAIVFVASVSHAASYRIPCGSVLALPNGARLTIPDGSILVTPDLIPEPRPPRCPEPPRNPGRRSQPPRRHTTSPAWTTYQPIREVNGLPPILADIESHLPAGHPYDEPDQVGTVHEGTHGINSLLRNRYGCPAFYVLEDRAVLIHQPATTLGAVAAQVPPSLRGDVYNLYLRRRPQWLESQPTYVFDEWVAYTNGADARRQLDIHDRQETVRYALEFCVYATCVPRASGSDDPQMREFLRWQIERVLKLAAGIKSDYLDRLRLSADAAELRRYMRDYFGQPWTTTALGF